MNKVRSKFSVYCQKQSLLGLAVIAFLLAISGNSLWQLWRQSQDSSWSLLFADRYFWHILRFSLLQATLSALLSVFIGLLTAHALFYRTFWAKKWLLKIFSLTFVLPVLVAVFGLIGIYGLSGWLNTGLGWLHIDWQPKLYGLNGILIAHLFFNLPLASKIFLQALHSIPQQQRQLAAQLNIRNGHFLRLIEWPYLRQQLLPVFALIFMLCFTSFAIVLTLGGGPKYTTLEVAIYQAVTFDFDLGKAAMLALVQFMLCFVLFQTSSYFSRHTPTPLSTQHRWRQPLNRTFVAVHWITLVSVALFIALPLLNIVYSGLTSSALSKIWQSPQLWQALGYSLTLAPFAALLALLLSIALLIGARRLRWHYQLKTANMMINIGMMILAIPTLVLAIGLFLLLQRLDFAVWHLFLIVALCNALIAMPFVLRILATPLNNNMRHYENLCQSLGIRGWTRWRLIEWHSLQNPLRSAYAYAVALSLGDFSAIALFGNQDFSSLPRLLYQQLGHYRSQEAAVTALILLLLCGLIFLVIEKSDDQSETTRI
ncbi:thiamine/thiamine pyrophosphate ABC transporter permease ThiP [Pasteurellaceae bacterium USgator11]|nr:thiamine/thiamine pyrophosphate ABC transporter permease ThiP [Pasteurellaceae bacterium UScroc12]TNG98315.1 thiamine/thiamine pyrophosphate ABC transporter permease ThiP [Pasteurellaceae bacterium USgator41]TNH01571.1 thiamine/thiamine pyrophosphate ABC transporter permease ThiP [Pasteurellaceae bacterium UScroc31]TNH02244.1 thiamine/thiamine pyrophosphate ABC transporter permease ThiP [Pasteurellaceae bacterium USgator11]